MFGEGRKARMKRISFSWLGVNTRPRGNYWCSSRFAKFLKRRAGIDSPPYLTWEDWEKYYDDYRKKAPLTFFFVENVLPSLQNIVSLPGDIFHTIRVYYSNAIKHKVHYLDTKLPRGKWYDTDIRMLCACMNALVDYVEIELALLYVMFKEDAKDLRADFYHFDRSERAGILYLEDKIAETFDITNYRHSSNIEEDEEYSECRESFEKHRKVYVEIYEIYKWWKHYFKNSVMDYAEESDREIEDKYLKKLIELRHSLWT